MSRSEDLVYGKGGDVELVARLYLPPSDAEGLRPAVVDVHGGAWYRGNYTNGAHYCQALAAKGLVVLALEFRDAALGGVYPQASQDIRAGVQYLRTHAERFSVDPERISLLGSSSGGHLALLNAILPQTARFAGTAVNLAPPGRPVEFARVDQSNAAIAAEVNGVVALWPVSDPLYRYRYAQRSARAELCAGHEAYFQTTAAMREASVPRVVGAGAAEDLPPLFVVQPGNDRNVPREMTRSLVDAWELQGGLVSCAFYPGMPHGFACRPGGLTDRCLHDVHGFLAACSAGAGSDLGTHHTTETNKSN